jgi:hypothetical protein
MLDFYLQLKFIGFSPDNGYLYSAGSGISGVTYTSVVTGDYIRMELSIHSRTQEENKSILDALISKRQQIESDFGKQLEWERMDDKRMSRIKYELPEVSVFHAEDWDKMIQFVSEVVPKFEAAFKKPISQLSRR